LNHSHLGHRYTQLLRRQTLTGLTFTDTKLVEVITSEELSAVLEREYKMFELVKNHSYNGISSNLEPIRTAWLGREDSNQCQFINKSIY